MSGQGEAENCHRRKENKESRQLQARWAHGLGPGIDTKNPWGTL